MFVSLKMPYDAQGAKLLSYQRTLPVGHSSDPLTELNSAKSILGNATGETHLHNITDLYDFEI